MSVNATYNITGMHCASCASNIEKNVKKIEGLENVSVNLASEKLSFDYPKDLDKTSEG